MSKTIDDKNKNSNPTQLQDKQKYCSTKYMLSLILFILFCLLITTPYISNNNIGTYVKLTTTKIENNHTTIVKESLVTIQTDNNKSNKQVYLKDNGYIYYGYFILIFLTIVLIARNNIKDDTIDD